MKWQGGNVFENSKHSALIGSFVSFQRPAEDILCEAAERGNDLYPIFQSNLFIKKQVGKNTWHVAQNI